MIRINIWPASSWYPTPKADRPELKMDWISLVTTETPVYNGFCVPPERSQQFLHDLKAVFDKYRIDAEIVTVKNVMQR